jgi:hypothetical protein
VIGGFLELVFDLHWIIKIGYVLDYFYDRLLRVEGGDNTVDKFHGLKFWKNRFILFLFLKRE